VLGADSLTLTPSGAPSRSILLREVGGIGGDDTAVELAIGAERVTLSQLGADGSTLRSDLQEAWLPARARALRLADAGEAFRFPGTVTFPGEAPAPCAGMVAAHAVLVARAGGDVQPIFLAEIERIEFDADKWCVWATRWDGGRVGFSHLAGRTDEVRLEMETARSVLSDEAAAALARWLPTVPPGDRSRLAARWLPGRFLSLADLDALAAGASGAVFASWVPSQPRSVQGAALREWAADGTVFAGYATDGDAANLWLLARRGERFLLESISLEDCATYRFAGGDELPSLAASLLCAPQFSREALYLPVEELTGERADYAIAARSLPFLRELRDRFRGRIIHTEPAAWRAALGSG
jgi:hypothetical protein